jgi:N-acetylmuramoyl-L-alanine amidase
MYRAALTCLVLALGGCVTHSDRSPLAEWHGSPNYDARRPRLIVIHDTEMESVDLALKVLSDPTREARVSAHYLIGDDGKILQLISERDRAWQAGRSRWGGVPDVNSISIGIELDNDGYEPFSDAQIMALLWLLDDICARYDLERKQVVGHADVAPDRKADPSLYFPWARLARAGFGRWPRDERAPPPPGFDPIAALRAIGYDTHEPKWAIRAFHRRYRTLETFDLDDLDLELLYDLELQVLAESTPLPHPMPITR